MSLIEDYSNRYSTHLVPLAEKIKAHIVDNLSDISRIDQITARAKSIDRFIGKSEKLEDGKTKYKDPLNEIQDQIGARVVVYYLDDIEIVKKRIIEFYNKIEEKTVVPDSDSEFGYFGEHFILVIPSDFINDDNADHIPDFFELQIKTLFQHAWGEAEHDLGYKPGLELKSAEKRKIAFTAAQAWGADQIFNELHQAANDPN